MITSRKHENRTVFWTDAEHEWEDLVAKGHVVYTAHETTLIAANPQVCDASFSTLLYRLKINLPVARLVDVKTETA